MFKIKQFLEKKSISIKFQAMNFLTFSYKPSMYLFKMRNFNFNTFGKSDKSTRKNDIQNKAGLTKEGQQPTVIFNNNTKAKPSNQNNIDSIDLDALTDNLEANSQFETNTHSTSTNLQNFNSLATNYLNRLVLAFIELMKDEKNVTVNIDEQANSVTIDVVKIGQYIISKDLGKQLITLRSPVSGMYKYSYDFNTGFWVNDKDSHIIDELLTREFCKHSKGLLIIN